MMLLGNHGRVDANWVSLVRRAIMPTFLAVATGSTMTANPSATRANVYLLP